VADLAVYIQEIKIIIPDSLQQGLTHTRATVETREAEVAAAAAQPTPIQAGLDEEYLGKDFPEAIVQDHLHMVVAEEEEQVE
jgi:hypothetical protein